MSSTLLIHEKSDEAEIWKSASGFPLYAVSSFGRVKRLITRTSGRAGAILKPALHYGGYFQHGLSQNNKTITVRLNRLVCETFFGPAPTNKHEAAHRDGNRHNNRPDNLYWATKLENEADKNLHGTRRRGSSLSSSKLTETKVVEIKQLRQQHGTIYGDLAIQFGVSKSLISQIIEGRVWKHVLAAVK